MEILLNNKPHFINLINHIYIMSEKISNNSEKSQLRALALLVAAVLMPNAGCTERNVNHVDPNDQGKRDTSGKDAGSSDAGSDSSRFDRALADLDRLDSLAAEAGKLDAKQPKPDAKKVKPDTGAKVDSTALPDQVLPADGSALPDQVLPDQTIPDTGGSAGDAGPCAPNATIPFKISKHWTATHPCSSVKNPKRQVNNTNGLCHISQGPAKLGVTETLNVHAAPGGSDFEASAFAESTITPGLICKFTAKIKKLLAGKASKPIDGTLTQ